MGRETSSTRVLGLGAVLLTASLVVFGCDEGRRTRRVVDEFAVVPGQPTVDSKTPAVETDPLRATNDFSVNVARQCDAFQQLSSRKVDILWVVDSSGSMGPKQARLAANFARFVEQLTSANPPIDFHIGVTTMDTDDPATRGRLRGWNIMGQGSDYIACTQDAQGGLTCNTGLDTSSAVTAFNQMARVGTTGSSVERGLLAAYLALTNPQNLSTQTETRFIRADAALYLVFVSDEDDSSCMPLARQSTCTADPGCRCAPETALSGTGAYGSVAYFTRFFETYKGYGNADAVAAAAIVALNGDAGVPSQFGDPSPHVGCCRADAGVCPTSGVNDGGFEISYFGGRYVQAAAATGGVTVSICDDDFSAALANLGYSASGLRREFRLSRGPDVRPMAGVAQGVTVFVAPIAAPTCMVDGNCPAGSSCRGGRCAQRVEVGLEQRTNGADYVKCDSAGLRNQVRFSGTAVPGPLSTVEICYDVLATFDNGCP